MPWQTAIIPATGPDNTPILSVIAKQTYDIGPGKVTVSARQPPLNQTDLPADPANPYYSENLAETDYVGFKPFTDVVVLAKARTPRGKKAFHLECEVVVGPAQKKIRVYGFRKLESRALRGLAFTDPEPFEEQEIGYCYAYGGMAKSKEGTLYSFPPNPLGKGFTLKSGFNDHAEIAVPHCEDPSSPIAADRLVLAKYDEWPKAPKPASFGWTKQNFFPRYTHAGILPEMAGGAAHESNAGLDPKKDLRFFQGASEGLCEWVLLGNEGVKLVYLDPEFPVFEFELPPERPAIEIKIGRDAQAVEPALHTVLIDKTENMLSMVWRGSRACDGAAALAETGFSYSAE